MCMELLHSHYTNSPEQGNAIPLSHSMLTPITHELHTDLESKTTTIRCPDHEVTYVTQCTDTSNMSCKLTLSLRPPPLGARLKAV